MSKPVYKRLSETYANMASLYIGLANEHAELAKTELPFPLEAIEQDPVPDPSPTDVSESVTVAADTPEEEAAKAAAEAALPLEDDTGEPMHVEDKAPLTMTAEEALERTEAANVLLQVGNAVGFAFVQETLKPFYGVEDPQTADIEQVRALVMHAKAQLAEKVGIQL